MDTLNKKIENQITGTMSSINPNALMEALAEKAEKTAQVVEDRAETAVVAASKKAHSYLEETREYVLKNPLLSLAVAATTGAAVGSVLTIIKRKNHKPACSSNLEHN